jgi:twitching motility protein PilT
MKKLHRIKDAGFTDLYLTKDRYSIKIDGAVSKLDEKYCHDVFKLTKLVFEYYEKDALASAGNPNFSPEQFSYKYDGQLYRVIIIHGFSGPTAALRKGNEIVSLWSDLGFPSHYLTKLIPSVDQTNINGKGGLILVAGKPDSGKTTTCYSLVNEILENSPLVCLTIEDPIETFLPQQYKSGAIVTQTEVLSVDFPKALKNALRYNADLIMAGEIRDEEGAQLALQGANTGHLVIATIHAADTVASLERFVTVAGDTDATRDIFSQVFLGCVWQSLQKRSGLKNRTLSCDAIFSTSSVTNKIKVGHFSYLHTEMDKQKSAAQNEVIEDA